MAEAEYLLGRKKYQRPQAMLWANNSGTIKQINGEGFYVPLGAEKSSLSYTSYGNEFIVLSDDNRQSIDFSNERIENRKRTINGRMRSYYIADKLSISTSWDMLPSRSFSSSPLFKENGGIDFSRISQGEMSQYTTDGGAGGNEILEWYQNTPGPFWVYLAYDKYTNFDEVDNISKYNNLAKYNEVVQVYFSDFTYSVVKRGGSNYDFWNISVTMEEV